MSCYQCGECGHFIAECPDKRDRDNDDDKRNKYKKEEKTHGFKKKYHKQAHIGTEWVSSDEELEDEGAASLAIKKSSSSLTHLINNLSSDDEDHPPCCTKVISKFSSYIPPSSDVENEFDNEDEHLRKP